MNVVRKILALALTLTLLAGMTTVYAVEADKNENELVLDYIPTTDFISGVSPYDGVVTVKVEGYDPYTITFDSLPTVGYISGLSPYDGVVNELSADEASAAGVPSGYEGKVTKSVGSGNYTGMTFDFSENKIPVNLIESVSFRFYFTSGATSFRLSNSGATNWIILSDVTSAKWVEYTISSDRSGFASGKSMSDLADEEGNLGVFGIGTKYGSGIYVDSIVISLKKDDGKAPVISYDGDTDIVTSAGKKLALNISAYDELEDRFVDPVFEWSEGAIDSNGKMLEGSHTLKISAVDYYGNSSSISLNVQVDPRDETPPEILFEASEIHVSVGTISRMVISCVDNYDMVDVISEWSEGAIDFGGRLYEGIHTLTLTATDLSGNKSVHVVTVYVTDGDSTVGQLVECGK